MRRHTITLGASTTAGGTVISAGSVGSINGVQMALEDDVIFCPVCKSRGTIKCIGPRIPETWNGKQIALEGDLCLCACSAPPKLISSQTLRYQEIEGATAGDASSIDREVGSNGNQSSTSAYDLFFVLQSKDSGHPLMGMSYKITLASGKVVKGISDQQGRTQLVSSSSPENATLEVPYYDDDTAPADANCGSGACDC